MAVADLVPDDGLIADYAGLVACLVARREALHWTQLELDAKAGWTDTYTSKLESAVSGPQGRRAGNEILRLWLQALGLRLQVVEVARPRTGRMMGPRFRHMVHRPAAAP